DDEERVRVQRSWLVGRKTGRPALVLQFSAAGQPFPEPIVPGIEQEGTLVFYPGASRLRAKWGQRDGLVRDLRERPPGVDTLGEFLLSYAEFHARSPWMNQLGHVVHQSVLVPGSPWHLVDREGVALPVAGSDHWRLLSISGGHPADIAGEWDGRAWR